MSILGINTATGKTEIALVEEKHIFFEKAWNSNYDEGEKVLPAIGEALKKSKNFPEKIFVVDGPGAFTGLRIGVTIANTLAFTKKIPLITCTTFEYLQKKIPDKYKKNTALMIKAGGEYVALQLPGKKVQKIFPQAEIATILKKNKIHHLIGDLKKEDLKKIQLPTDISFIPHKELKSFGPVIQEMNHQKMTNHAIVKPHYLQPPKITMSKKQIFVTEAKD